MYNKGMEILSFLGQNWVYIVVAMVLLFIILGAWVANSSFDKYIETFKKMQGVKTSFDDSCGNFGVFLANRYFGGEVIVKAENADEIKSQGAYSPARKTVTLSDDIAYKNSLAGVAIVAHEFGHAMQHKKNPKILVRNFKLTKFVKFLGFLNFVFIGLAVYFFATGSLIPAIVFVVLLAVNFLIAIILKISTLRLEKNASDIAMKILIDTKIFSKKELALCKKFLTTAKKTYTADLFRALLSWTGLTRKTKIF